MTKQVHLLITGRVQGVFYRASASQVARSLGLKGFVRNLPDGAVELVGEGEEEKLARLIDWCRKGPPGAHVDEVKADWGQETHQFSGFNTR